MDSIFQTLSEKNISKYLNININTVKRWKVKNKIPSLYLLQLAKILKINIDLKTLNYIDKDQFYTPLNTAEYCYLILSNILKKYNENIHHYGFIEPSAGSGNFVKVLTKYNHQTIIAMDIEPIGENILIQDYLDWKPLFDGKKYVVLGNPPFGLRGQLALQFINHSSSFADFVAFILPQLFISDGKGVPRKRILNYNLIHSEPLTIYFETPIKVKKQIPTIFQIWSKKYKNDTYSIIDIDKSIFKIISLSNGGTPSTTRNKKFLNQCDLYLPSTCFGKENMKFYPDFISLPNQRGYGIIIVSPHKETIIKNCESIDWTTIAFLSTNSAYNLRISHIYTTLMNCLK